MAWRTIGTVQYSANGKEWTRRVARDDSTGETERTYGTEKYMTSQGTSRSLGRTSSDREALVEAQRDLARTFK